MPKEKTIKPRSDLFEVKTRYRLNRSGDVDEKLWRGGWQTSLSAKLFGFYLIKYQKEVMKF